MMFHFLHEKSSLDGWGYKEGDSTGDTVSILKMKLKQEMKSKLKLGMKLKLKQGKILKLRLIEMMISNGNSYWNTKLNKYRKCTYNSS